MRGSITLRTTKATHPRMIAVVAATVAGTLVAAILIMLMTASARAVVPGGNAPSAGNEAPLVTDPDATLEGEFAPGEVRAKDQAGNVDLSAAERSFTVDAIPEYIGIDTSVGTAAPRATLGGYTMTPFAQDSRSLFQSVSDVPAPGGGTLLFDRSMGHYRIGSGWLTWSHGYTGDVYSNASATSPTRDQVMMTLPANTKAFYFYVEPRDLATYNVTATANDGTTSNPIAVSGSSGAKYFGFYSKDGTTLNTITVNVDAGARGFAIGEFGIGYSDTTKPTVTAVQPAAGAIGVTIGTNVVATFSEPMDASDTDGDPSTLTTSTFTLIKQGSSTPVGAQVSYDSASKNATLDPTSDLEANTTYTATIKGGSTGAEDLAGNALAQDYSWSFTTAAPPALNCTITGTANAETITGTSGADVLCGLGGNDILKGLEGNDILRGAGGNDTLQGGVGDDTLDGGTRTDTASYSTSLTAVSASLATNSSTGEGSDTFAGVENLLGSSKADTLTGSGANNTLTGGGGGDTERGGSGDDQVIGSGGADFLYGQDGADTVNSKDGVNGNDTLSGGTGTDTKITDATEKSIIGFP